VKREKATERKIEKKSLGEYTGVMSGNPPAVHHYPKRAQVQVRALATAGWETGGDPKKITIQRGEGRPSPIPVGRAQKKCQRGGKKSRGENRAAVEGTPEKGGDPWGGKDRKPGLRDVCQQEKGKAKGGNVSLQKKQVKRGKRGGGKKKKFAH